MVNKKLLWINFSQKVSYSVGLHIGKDFTLEKANEIIAQLDGEYSISNDDPKAELLLPYSRSTYAHTWDDYEDIEVYIEEEKE